MDEQPKQEETQSNTMMYYILGAVILAVIVVAAYLLRPKASTTESTPQNPTTNTTAASPVTETINTGPITKLGCEKQYYNPVVGLPKYYLSAEGVNVTGATQVNCTFSVTVNKEVIATYDTKSDLTPAPERNGSTFRCITKQLELPASVPAKVDVALKDDKQASATCTATFLLPKP